MEMIPITGIMDNPMPAACRLCSSAWCCVASQPFVPKHEREPEEFYQEFARLYPDPRNRLVYWGVTVTRARARVARTREETD